ncbi:tRNA-dihydrouridine synthase family protein [Oligoflexus tunisiensis]|uniref:tRNA-dihydrouridine synthase family protein n=1 Tax=Oligoflexus tunisiensis TaxID=708132 RepID=UPI00114CCE87|nr:tRNA-dihydrouridine synthase family protein [Oligoflexus tunisiensis]
MVRLPELSVAPMEGVTTFPMRLWLTMTSQPPAMTSPFLKVTRAFPESALPDTFIPELMQLREALPYELVPQFITGEPEQFLRAAAFIPPTLAPVIEINCGCPSPNSMGRYAGSGMLSDPEFFARSIETLSQELGPGRLAVKMRLGVQSDAEFPALLAALTALPLARLTVHARTRADGYRGQARWTEVQRAASGTRLPVFASGDVWGWTSWQRLQSTAPDIRGAMIGRGLLRNPWIFCELQSGTKTRMPALVFVNALFCYALLQEIFLRDAGKLFQRVVRGRLGSICGVDFGAWEKATVELTNLVFGVPFLLLQKDSLKPRTLSPVAFSRLRFLWSYLRSSLPEPLAAPGLMRCRQAPDFFELLLETIEDAGLETIEVSHQEAWDAQFAGLRG